MTISKSRGNPTRYKVVVGGWTLIVQRSSLLRVTEAVVVILASAALFFVGQAHALRERGYEAIGGEYLLLALPVLYYLLRATIKDYIADIHDPAQPKPTIDEWGKSETRANLYAAMIQATTAFRDTGARTEELSEKFKQISECLAPAFALAHPMTDIAFLAPNHRLAGIAYGQFLRDNNLVVSGPHRKTLKDGSRITPITPSHKECYGRRFDQVIVATDSTGQLAAETATAIERLMEIATGRVPEEFFVQFYDMDAEQPRDDYEGNNV